MRVKRVGLAVVFVASLGLSSAGCAQVLGIEDWEPQATGDSGTGASGGGGDPSAGGGGTDASGATTTTTTTTGPGSNDLICGQAFPVTVDNKGTCVCSVCDPADHSSCYDDCENGAKDFNESDADCGGPQCARCEIGQGCQRDCDCASKSCVLSKCAVASSDVSKKCLDACGTSD